MKLQTRYVTTEEWESLPVVERAILKSRAFINCSVWEYHDGQETRIFTFLPTREVYFKFGDGPFLKYTQEEFAERRSRSLQQVGDMFKTLLAPRKGKGIMDKKRKARDLFRSLMGDDPLELKKDSLSPTTPNMDVI